MDGSVEIAEGISFFEGRFRHNLTLNPIVSNAYFLEDGNEAFIFDPACGKEIGRRLAAHIRNRHAAGVKWKKAFIVVGHSHFDHAGNLYLGDLMGADETRILLHEKGFEDGKVLNHPTVVLRKQVEQARGYYNPYLSFFGPFKLLTAPFAALDALAPEWTLKVFERIATIHAPAPINGRIPPQPLKEDGMQELNLDGIEMPGWRVGKKVILPMPGHSPCSVSLYWPERKALFIGDVDWIGNPVAMSSSLRGCISSLESIKVLAAAGLLELLLPGHGEVKRGTASILTHIDFHIQRLKLLRVEILQAFHSSGEEKRVPKLTGILVKKSPLFRTLKECQFPRVVLFLHAIVAVCLREEGLLA
jgi:glyoxylase-like metal-dependent hydrolase (beta-lactamase superfamily II)